MYAVAGDRSLDEEDECQGTDRGIADWTGLWSCFREEDSPSRPYGFSSRRPKSPRLLRKRTLGTDFRYFPSQTDPFDDLVAKWQKDARYESLTYRVAMSLPYQQMISLGSPALPRILACLETDPSPHWFWALRVIAREDPAQDEQTVEGAVDAWLRWGRSNKLLPG